MSPGYLRGLLVKTISSLLCAGIFYFVWLGAFLLAARLDGSVVEAGLWLLAPVVTATGFTVGITLLERLTGTTKTRFFRIFIWPVVGCAIGAGVVYWFGPMLIVFGMFAVGTVSIVLREVVEFSSGKHA